MIPKFIFKRNINQAVNLPTPIVTPQTIPVIAHQYIHSNRIQDINTLMPFVIPQERNMTIKQEVSQTPVQEEILQDSNLNSEVNQSRQTVTPQRMFKNRSHTVNQPMPMVTPRQRIINTTPDAHW